MLKMHTLLVLTALATKNLTAQQTLEVLFEDGTKMQFTVIESRGEQMNRNWIYNGYGSGDQGEMSTIGFQHFRAGVFSAGVEAHIQPFLFLPEKLAKIGAEGTFYFKSFEKQKPRDVTLKSSYVGANTTVKYRAKVEDVYKNKYLGAHLEFSYNAYITSDYDYSSVYRITNASATGIAVGLSYTGTSHIKVGFGGNEKDHRQGTTYFRAIADFLYNPTQKVEAVIKDPQPNVDYSPLDPKKVFASKAGFRLLLDGHSSMWARGDWGLNYQLGVMKTTYALRSGGSSFAPVVRLGIYIGFGDPK